jgi:hypothetical protein
MKTKRDWISPPDELAMDWEYIPINSLGERHFVRLTDRDISGLFGENEVFVRITTGKRTYTGRLLDIGEGGLLLSLSVLLEMNLPLQVGFILGKVKIISKAMVRHALKRGDWYKTGIEFVDLRKESAEYIAELYASKALCLGR